MSKHAREDARKRIVNFYNDAADGNLKSVGNYFLKQGMERRMVHSILQRYKQYRITKDLPRFDHPVKLSSRKLGDLVRKINNESGVSQRHHARRFMVAQSTIFRNLKERTNIKIYKRTKAPKYSKDQSEHAQNTFRSIISKNFEPLFCHHG